MKYLVVACDLLSSLMIPSVQQHFVMMLLAYLWLCRTPPPNWLTVRSRRSNVSTTTAADTADPCVARSGHLLAAVELGRTGTGLGAGSRVPGGEGVAGCNS